MLRPVEAGKDGIGLREKKVEERELKRSFVFLGSFLLHSSQTLDSGLCGDGSGGRESVSASSDSFSTALRFPDANSHSPNIGLVKLGSNCLPFR